MHRMPRVIAAVDSILLRTPDRLVRRAGQPRRRAGCGGYYRVQRAQRPAAPPGPGRTVALPTKSRAYDSESDRCAWPWPRRAGPIRGPGGRPDPARMARMPTLPGWLGEGRGGTVQEDLSHIPHQNRDLSGHHDRLCTVHSRLGPSRWEAYGKASPSRVGVVSGGGKGLRRQQGRRGLEMAVGDHTGRQPA